MENAKGTEATPPKKLVKNAGKKATATKPAMESKRMNIIRIPTADQYAYIEVKFEGTTDDAYAEYQRLTAIIRGGDGLEPKAFNAILDEYLATDKITGDPGMVSEMNLDQQMIIQAIKRSRARTNK